MAQVNSTSTGVTKHIRTFLRILALMAVVALPEMSVLGHMPADSKSAKQASGAIVGSWKGSIKGAPDDPLDFTMDVWSENGSLKGEIKTFQGDVSKGKIRIIDGSYANGEFTANLINEANSAGKFVCKIKGNNSSGTWSIATISGTFTAKKVSTLARK